MAVTSDNFGPETPATIVSPRRRLRRRLLVFPILLLAALLWGANWYCQRSRLFEDSVVAFGPPRWRWLEPILEEAATEFCGIPILLYNANRPLTPYQVRMVGSYESLEGLSLTGLTDKDLKHLSGLINLTGLAILDSQITAEGCQYLAGMQKLRHLTLESPHLDDACLSYLSELSELRRLQLNGGSFSEQGFDSLAQLPMLSGMTIMNCQLSGDALRPIAERSGVAGLDFHDSNVTDEMLAPFEEHRNLYSLTIRGTPVSREACVRLIEAMPRLSIGTDYDLPPRDLPGGDSGFVRSYAVDATEREAKN